MKMCNKTLKKMYTMIQFIFLLFTICPSIANLSKNQRILKTFRNHDVGDNNGDMYQPWSSLLETFEHRVPWISSKSKNQHTIQNPLRNLRTKENHLQINSEGDSYSNPKSVEDVIVKRIYNDFPINETIIDPWRPIEPKLCPIPLPIPDGPHRNESSIAPDIVYTIPPNVSDLCPAPPNDLSPCTCVGKSGSNAGLISISCNASTNWTTMGEVKYTLNNADYITTDVVKFNMSGTNVGGVVDNSLWGNLNIQQIIMNDNQIRDIDNHAFISSRDSLYLLSLTNNLIASFFWQQLSEVPHLGTLRLMGNQIQLISTAAFPLMPALSILDLSYNQIDWIGQLAFNNLAKLTNLKLNNNNMTTLFNNVFSITNHAPKSNFFSLNISNNQIETLNPDTFSGIKPNRIDLSYNNLKSIQQSIFEPLILAAGFLIDLHFEGNPILCDCNLFWVVNSTDYPFVFQDFQCADRNKTFYQLNNADFNCTLS